MTESDPGESAAALPRTVIERPPPGPARGKLPVPAWAVLLLGGVVALAAVFHVVRRALARGKK